MNADVNKDGCIACGLCSQICPEVFDKDENEIAYVKHNPVSPEAEESASEARESCPVSVIDLS
ncbi:MAG: ferredoxin [Bacillota bacterium]|nr:ferredoxin [Bacillota bacterium]